MEVAEEAQYALDRLIEILNNLVVNSELDKKIEKSIGHWKELHNAQLIISRILRGI